MNGTIIAAIIAALASVIGVILNIIFNSSNTKKNAQNNEKLKKEIVKLNNNFTQKTAFRLEISNYLTELVRVKQNRDKFVEQKRKLEAAFESLQALQAEGANLNAILGNDPRIDVQNAKNEIKQLADEIEVLRISIEQHSQQLLLYFNNNSKNKKIEEIITYAPNAMKNLQSHYHSNLNLDMLVPLLSAVKIEKNINDIKTEMRTYLNSENTD
ncbi:hypothetical protein VNN28_06305 [Lactococcus formosensis]|uniref:hypothetical protein n=1 Tax=Lactococcus formosensis TaxID=1281486 RepID=UPI0030D2664D